jgi:hypothetical protein
MINKTSKSMYNHKNNIYVGKWEYKNLGKIKVNNKNHIMFNIRILKNTLKYL